MRSERRPSRVEQLNVPTGKPDWTGAEQGQQRAPEVRPRPRRAGVTLGRDPKPPEPPRGDGNGHERGLSRADAEKWRRESPELCGRRTKTLKAQLRRMASNGRAPDQGEGSQGLRLEGRTGGQPWCRPGPAKVAAGVAVSGILFFTPRSRRTKRPTRCRAGRLAVLCTRYRVYLILMVAVPCGLVRSNESPDFLPAG